MDDGRERLEADIDLFIVFVGAVSPKETFTPLEKCGRPILKPPP